MWKRARKLVATVQAGDEVLPFRRRATCAHQLPRRPKDLGCPPTARRAPDAPPTSQENNAVCAPRRNAHPSSRRCAGQRYPLQGDASHSRA